MMGTPKLSTPVSSQLKRTWQVALRGISSCRSFSSVVPNPDILTTSKPRRPKTAILMLNLGGPANLSEVQPFLQRLFSDPDLIPIPFQKHLAPIIAKGRTPKIQAQYAQIGGGSPIRMWTELQGKLLEHKLDQLCPESAPHKTFATFRYAAPLTEDSLAEIRRLDIKRAVAFTQYPQYSCSTTGSSLNELYRKVKEMQMEEVRWSVIDRWPVHHGLVKAFADRITAALSRFPKQDHSKFVILFSAHSLPMTIVNRGDPYVQEVSSTVQSVMEYLGHSHPFRLAWQSKVGPRKWMGPQTLDVLKGLAKKGQKHVLMVPIAFTSDHIETLYELDLEYGEEAKELGITHLHRAESLNDSPLFISAMTDLVSSHLKANQEDIKISRLMELQCPMCEKSNCKESKEFFKQQRLMTV